MGPKASGTLSVTVSLRFPREAAENTVDDLIPYSSDHICIDLGTPDLIPDSQCIVFLAYSTPRQSGCWRWRRNPLLLHQLRQSSVVMSLVRWRCVVTPCFSKSVIFTFYTTAMTMTTTMVIIIIIIIYYYYYIIISCFAAFQCGLVTRQLSVEPRLGPLVIPVVLSFSVV